ncbi:MAG: hypothetical protein DCC55_37145 [Chloroflexi bacterium]|nr:MAG: hypothetical protein DCC55_37145 [Chloroflexota bacterium]
MSVYRTCREANLPVADVNQFIWLNLCKDRRRHDDMKRAVAVARANECSNLPVCPFQVAGMGVNAAHAPRLWQPLDLFV